MVRLRHAFATSAAAALILLGAGSAEAVDLAVPGRSPANPLAVVSVPSTDAFWPIFSKSPVGKAFVAALAGAEKSAAVKSAEEASGLDLSPDSIMTGLISGFDFYTVKVKDAQSAVVAIKFNDPASIEKIISTLKNDTKGAFGVSGGFSADTIEERVEGKVKIVDFPAFQLYFAAEGSNLIVSTDRPTRDSALKDEGGNLFTSDYFSGFMAPLQNADYNAWLFGDLTSLTPIFLASNGEILEDAGKSNSAAILNVTPTGFKLTQYTPKEELSEAEKLRSAGAQTPGPAKLLASVPGSATTAWVTNNFDGVAVKEDLAHALAGADVASIEGVPFKSAKDLETKIEGSKQAVGFDLRRDLLDYIGPDFSLVSFPVAEGEHEFVVTSGTKDATKVTSAIEAMRKKLTPAAPPRAKDDKTPAVKPKPPFAVHEANGVSVNTYEGKNKSLAGLSYALTEDGKLYVSLSAGAIEAALAQSADGGLAASAEGKSALGQVSANRNSLLVVRPKTDLPVLRLMIGADAGMEGIVEALGQAKLILSSKSYLVPAGGKFEETVIVM